jgi:hypothetical protein
MLGGTFSFFLLDWQSFLITRCVARPPMRQAV